MLCIFTLPFYGRGACQTHAEPPQDKLSALLGKSQKFRNSWNHNRGFRSLSEYDMSLATLASNEGWEPQEIINLLIAFRRRHGKARADREKALRQDYLERMLSKVLSSITQQRKCKVNDTGNARRLVLRHGKNIQYVPHWKKWLIWDGTRWTPDDKGYVVELAKETITSMYAQANTIEDKKERKDFVKAVKRQEYKSRITAMIQLAQSVPGIPLLPKQLDTDPEKLCVLNGVVDLRTGELLPHKRDDLITKQAPVIYDPDASSELFDSFKEKILPDPEVRNFVQRAAGYSLLGSNQEEILLFIYGPPASGKSTLMRVIKETLGDYAVVSDFETFTTTRRSGSPRNDIARLAGKRLLLSNEIAEGAKMAETLVKQVTGGDVVAARFLREEFFEFIPQFTLWLTANNRPRIDSVDGAIWRRIREIPFEVAIPEEERDPLLKRELCDLETHGPAVLTWLVKGCLEYYEKGLEQPTAVSRATEEYREEMDHIATFLGDCVLLGPNYRENNTALYDAYVKWCRFHRIHPVGRKTFTQDLQRKGYVQKRQGRQRLWEGIELDIDDNGNLRIEAIRIGGRKVFPRN